MAQIGIVTVLYNSENVLSDFFKSLEEQTYRDFTLYVVDNASTDRSLQRARELADEVSFKCVFFEEKSNWGVAKGNNIGIRAALADGCRYVLLSNNDTRLRPDTIELLLKGLEEMKADMAVPKIFIYDTDLLWSAGGRFHWLRGSTSHFGSGQPDGPQYDRRRFVEYSPTCFMLIRSDVFDKVGLMDEKYFVYYDDTDFVFRAVKRHGLRLAYVPESTMEHNEGSSTGSAHSPFKLRYMNRNARYFCNKNYTFPKKQLNQLYSYLAYRLKMPRVFTPEQMEIIARARKEGNNL